MTTRPRVLGDEALGFRAAVIGHPVAHSLSPRIHDAAYAALGLDWRYGAFDVEPGRTVDAFREARDAGYVGLSVTTPLKFEAAGVFPGSEDVELVGAANTVVFGEQGPRVHNTDGEGLVAELQQSFAFDPGDRRCAVIGAGATARAIVRALDAHRASEIIVVDPSPARASAAAQLGGATARVGGERDLGGIDLVVYAAKPARDTAAAALASVIERGQLVVDVNYHPARSAFLDACAERGAVIANGLGMLVHQAALQVELFTGRPAPLELMWEAVGRDATAEPGAP